MPNDYTYSFRYFLKYDFTKEEFLKIYPRKKKINKPGDIINPFHNKELIKCDLKQVKPVR